MVEGLTRSRSRLVYTCFYQRRWPNSTTIFGHPGMCEGRGSSGEVAENWGLTVRLLSPGAAR